MSMGVVCEEGGVFLLEYAVNFSSPQNLVLRLFTNDFTPDRDSVAADFTEASGSGYSAKTLTGGSWTVTAGQPCNATYAVQTFTFSGALGDVYGYYMTRASGGEVVFARRFGVAPVTIASGADDISIAPVITLPI